MSYVMVYTVYGFTVYGLNGS